MIALIDDRPQEFVKRKNAQKITINGHYKHLDLMDTLFLIGVVNFQLHFIVAQTSA